MTPRTVILVFGGTRVPVWTVYSDLPDDAVRAKFERLYRRSPKLVQAGLSVEVTQ